MPVGALADARFAQVDLHLGPGDLLFTHTDGVTEAQGGAQGTEMFGGRRLRRALAAVAGLPPAELVERVLRLLDQWCAGQHDDDVAVLAIAADGG
ncbi:PP2C family protein-serine/threonine phosphatase [Micromonospora sp. LOL_024]|uniref:PP2C family protein-serine/threonine phosphatase n=1 Tax=Micromonospora sp. LOL_024 TaxID=3345412 RepID=UPI003A84FBB5